MLFFFLDGIQIIAIFGVAYVILNEAHKARRNNERKSQKR